MFTKKDLLKMGRDEKLAVVKEYVKMEGSSPSACLRDPDHAKMGCAAVRAVQDCGGTLRMESGQYWNGSVMKKLSLWAFYLNDAGQLCLQCGGRNANSLRDAACWDPVPEADISDADLDAIILEWEL